MKEYTSDTKLFKDCIKNKRAAQKELYKRYYSYAISISIRYSDSRRDAVEITNDAFMKVFTHLKSFDRSRPFEPWLRRIVINCAIDYYKRNKRNENEYELIEGLEKHSTDSQLDSISYSEMIGMIQELSPGYRAVFNLYAIEGYKHEEIAEILGITVGTSKSNYFKAKKKLQEYLHLFFEVE